MHKISFSLLLLLMTACGGSNKPKENATVTNAMWQSEVIVPMKEALERLAVVSPKFGTDTDFPLLRATCMPDIYDKEVADPIMETAYKFDSLTTPLKEAAINERVPRAMSELDFFEFMKESTKRKVQMLDFLTMAICRKKFRRGNYRITEVNKRSLPLHPYSRSAQSQEEQKEPSHEVVG